MQEPGEAPSESHLVLFLHHLLKEGRAVVSVLPPEPPGRELLQTLEAWELYSRDDLCGESPEFTIDASAWAATQLYQICRFIACRDLGEVELRQAFAVVCPASRSASTHWSIDVVLRHLPELCRLASHLSNADPLVEELKKLAVEWPLSSVGIAGLEGFEIDSFIMHPALARLYADRITAANDHSRLGDPRVDNLLRADFGAHHELAPGLRAHLARETTRL